MCCLHCGACPCRGFNFRRNHADDLTGALSASSILTGRCSSARLRNGLARGLLCREADAGILFPPVTGHRYCPKHYRSEPPPPAANRDLPAASIAAAAQLHVMYRWRPALVCNTLGAGNFGRMHDASEQQLPKLFHRPCSPRTFPSVFRQSSLSSCVHSVLLRGPQEPSGVPAEFMPTLVRHGRRHITEFHRLRAGYWQLGPGPYP